MARRPPAGETDPVTGTAARERQPGADAPEDPTGAVLRRYLDELYLWSARINLTAVPRSEAERRHIGESRRLLEAAAPAAGARVVDVGSGGGVPGLVLAVLRPDLRVTLVESDRRRAGFLVHAAGVCGCRGVTVLARRAEDVGRDPAHRAGYELAVSRAAAPVAVLCELALPLLRQGGRLVALVGDAAAEADRAATAAAACGGGEPREVGHGILAITKVAATPERFPRRPGLPSRHPLGA